MYTTVAYLEELSEGLLATRLFLGRLKRQREVIHVFAVGLKHHGFGKLRHRNKKPISKKPS